MGKDRDLLCSTTRLSRGQCVVLSGRLMHSCKLLYIIAVVFLAGCASPRLVMTTEGLSNEIPNKAGSGQYAVLSVAFNAAKATALAAAESGVAPTISDQAKYQELALDGMGTVDDNCSDFFTLAGEHEKYVDFSRDVVTVIGTVASGAMALTQASKNAVAAVILTTGTLYSSFDVYTKNFLFGADNIDSVRTLIMNALDTHHQVVVGDKAPWNFNNAMRVILDHQEICRPSAIISLVRAAIKAGKLTPVQQAGASDPAVAAQDKNVALLVARDVGYQKGTVPPDELAALYWLYADRPSAAELKSIKGTLAGLPQGPYNKDGSDNTTTWNATKDAIITEDLKNFSASATTAFDKQIADWKTQLQAGAAGPPKLPGAAAALPPRSQTTSTAPPGGTKHYSITVQ